MSTTTPYLGLTLYDSSTDQAVTFATFRAVWGGTATTSNFYKVDTAMSGLNTRITSLENNAGAISVPMTYISANYYEASGISGITAYNTGATIIVNLDVASAGTVTLNINSLGTKSLMKINTAGSATNIEGGELKKNVRYLFVYDGTRWLWVSQKEKNDGWQDEGNTWTYSSIDSPTGIVSINADMTSILQKGMKVKYNQAQALTGYCSFDATSAWDVGAFTSTDTAMTYTGGKFSNAATFNGTTSKIVVTDTALLKPTGEFTLGMWFKTSTTGTDKLLFQSFGGLTNYGGISMSISAGNLLSGFTYANTGTTVGTDYFIALGKTNVCDNAWHYGVLTFRNNYLQLYVDGILEASVYAKTPAYQATNYVRIGCQNLTGSDGAFMNGQIDDFFLINGYALDEKTIYDKYILATAQGTGNITVTKNAIVTKVGAYSASATLVTMYHGNDFMLANATISSPYYSGIKAPFGFNLNPDKWSVILSSDVNYTKTTPGSGAWYAAFDSSVSIPSIVAPIGNWNGLYQLYLSATTTGAQTIVSIFITLSNAVGTESDNKTTSILGMSGASGTLIVNNTLSKRFSLDLLTKSTRYLNVKSNQALQTVVLGGATVATEIRLVSAYL